MFAVQVGHVAVLMGLLGVQVCAALVLWVHLRKYSQARHMLFAAPTLRTTSGSRGRVKSRALAAILGMGGGRFNPFTSQSLPLSPSERVKVRTHNPWAVWCSVPLLAC